MITSNLNLIVIMNELIPANQIELRYARPHVSKLLKLVRTSDAIKSLRPLIEKGKLDLKEYHWVLLLTADNGHLGI